MRCSNCNGNVRPVVAIDIDGTLAMWYEGFIQFLEMYLPPEQLIEMHRHGRIRDWDGLGEFRDRLGLDVHTYQAAKLAFRQSGLKRSLVPYRGAKKMMDAARRQGAEIWVTTTRPWLSLDNVDADTREWLRRNDIPYDHLLFGEDKMGDLVQRVDPLRIVMVLDNEIEVFERCEELALPALLRLNAWNKAHHERRLIAKGLSEAAHMMTERIGAWDGLVGRSA